MASSISNILKLLLLLSALSLSRIWALSSSPSYSSSSSSSPCPSPSPSPSPSSITPVHYFEYLCYRYIKSICKTTPYLDVSFETLEPSINDIPIDASPNNTAYYLVYTFKTAINEFKEEPPTLIISSKNKEEPSKTAPNHLVFFTKISVPNQWCTH